MEPGTAIVVAGDEEIRVLLRGLLRLHRFRILGEATGEPAALELVRAHRPKLLLTDVRLNEGTVTELVPAARKVVPEIRAVVVAPPGPEGRAGHDARPDALLQRPFRVRDFAEAVGAGPPPGPP